MIKNTTARRAAPIVALVTAATLALRVFLSIGLTGSILAALSFSSQYFTVPTNVLTLLLMGSVAVGRPIGSDLMLAAIVAIGGVGVIYHAVLANLWAPRGMELIADQGLHTVAPLCALGWWLASGHSPDWTLRTVASWLIWPLAYCIYALVRAQFNGFYPYPFIDIPQIGWPGLARNVVGLTLRFALLGTAILALGRAIPTQPR